MNNTYTIKKTKIIEVLNDVDEFVTRFQKFSIKFPKYSYNINVLKEGKQWVANVNIKTDETDKNKTT